MPHSRWHRVMVMAVVAALLGTTAAAGAAAGEPRGIGSGDPGLKVATRGPDAVVIYADEPVTVGTGLMGGMMDRRIRVLFDRQYHFRQDRMEIASQLYPLDAASAFSSDGGTWSADFKHWDYLPRKTAGFRLAAGRLTTIGDVQKAATEEYGLKPGEVFLGRIDDRVFFWRDFNPARVYWRVVGATTVYAADMPKGVIDVYGVTRGIHRDVGFVVFRKSPGFIHYSPYRTDFIEVSLDGSVPVSSKTGD